MRIHIATSCRWLATIGLLLFSISNCYGQSRWSTTATNGSGLGLGDPTTLTWGFVPNGTDIEGFNGEPRADSDLITNLDTWVTGDNSSSNLQNKAWFTLFESVFDRWDQISGLTFVYEPNDDGVSNNSRLGRFAGVLGTRADLRIGGHFIDGQDGRNVLAYNFFPDNGDMVIDTSNDNFYSDATNNYRGMRNVISHEFGHGMGLPHFESSNSNGLMEPVINNSFDGPQIDDIHQAQRRYGDQLEENGGNNNSATATALGNLMTGSGLVVGEDANMGDTVVAVEAGDTDFVSIDDNSDIDFFSFTLTEFADVIIDLEMVGPEYQRGPQNGTQNPFDLSMQNDLDLALFDTNGSSLLGQSNTDGLGISESIQMELNAGTYFVRVTGNDNAAQFYQLNITAVPEPGSAALIIALVCGAGLVRRRKQVR